MAGKYPNWVIGCAAGCGLLLLIAVAAVGALGFFVHRTIEGFDTALESRDALETRFGEPETFVPWPDGGIPAERVEAFLAVRQSTAQARNDLADVFAEIPLSEEEALELEMQSTGEQLRSAMKISRSALGLAGKMGRFFKARNEALLAEEMGLGEYSYLYCVVYFGWLGHSPEEGPGGRIAVSADDAAEVPVGHDDAPLGTAITKKIRGRLLSMLTGQLETLEATADFDPAWRDALAAEIVALRSDPDRIPWEDGLPEVIAAPLEPFRERLESSYESASNPFELLRNRKQGRFSVTAE